MTVAVKTPHTSGNACADEDRQVALDDPAIPHGIRAALTPHVHPGCTLWRCPRHRPKGSDAAPAHRPDVMIEWWLLDAHGDLIDSFWEVTAAAATPQQTATFSMPGLLLLLFCLTFLATAGSLLKTGAALFVVFAVLLVFWGGDLILKILFPK